MPDPNSPLSKRQVLEQALAAGTVTLQLDARRPGVRVPEAHQGDMRLRLNVSLHYKVPPRIEDWGVSATLTFSGRPFACRAPWDAIYQIFAHGIGQTFLFPAEVPADLPPAPPSQS